MYHARILYVVQTQGRCSGIWTVVVWRKEKHCPPPAATKRTRPYSVSLETGWRQWRCDAPITTPQFAPSVIVIIPIYIHIYIYIIHKQIHTQDVCAVKYIYIYLQVCPGRILLIAASPSPPLPIPHRAIPAPLRRSDDDDTSKLCKNYD